MAIPVEQLEAEVLSLDAADRARILDRLIASFDTDTSGQDAWVEEALRREAEVAAGKTALLPGREAIDRIRKQLT